MGEIMDRTTQNNVLYIQIMRHTLESKLFELVMVLFGLLELGFFGGAFKKELSLKTGGVIILDKKVCQIL